MVHQIKPEIPPHANGQAQSSQQNLDNENIRNQISGDEQEGGQRQRVERLPPYFLHEDGGPNGALQLVDANAALRDAPSMLGQNDRLTAFRDAGLELRRLADTRHRTSDAGKGLEWIADHFWHQHQPPDHHLQVSAFCREDDVSVRKRKAS